jgi:hypothetical protein
MDIPHSKIQHKFVSLPQNLETRQLFQIGWDLIAREEAATSQHIITKLGAEAGVAMIKALTELMDTSETEDNTLSIFGECTLPFYRIISHPDVPSSFDSGDSSRLYLQLSVRPQRVAST